MMRTHTNPDGTTVDVPATAMIGETVHIGKAATIGPCAVIHHGIIRGGTIAGGTIWGGTIWGGTIAGGTIRGGTIRGGTIAGGTIAGGTIWGGTIDGGTIDGGTIRGGTIRGGTIRGGTIRSIRDVVAAGPVGNEPSLFTAVPNDDRTGWLIVGGCSRAVPFDLDSGLDPFVDDFPPKSGELAEERAAALEFLRFVCRARSLEIGGMSAEPEPVPEPIAPGTWRVDLGNDEPCFVERLHTDGDLGVWSWYERLEVWFPQKWEPDNVGAGCEPHMRAGDLYRLLGGTDCGDCGGDGMWRCEAGYTMKADMFSDGDELRSCELCRGVGVLPPETNR